MIKRTYFVSARIYHDEHVYGERSETSFAMTTKGIFADSPDKLLSDARNYIKKEYSDTSIKAIIFTSFNRI